MARTANKKATAKTRKKQDRSEVIARSVAIALFVMCMLTVAFWQVQNWFMDPATLPIRVVRIDGELKYLQKAELENAVASEVSGGFFNINLMAIMDKAHRLPWVDEVRVRRVWPDTVVMDIRERKAVARWGDKRLVTSEGEIFSPKDVIPEGLPLLKGMDNRVKDVVDLYMREKQRFTKMGLQLTTVSVDKRGAWSMAFGNGLRVAIGRIDINKRLERLTENFMAIKKQGHPEYIDLRYRHGIAVSWEQDKGAV